MDCMQALEQTINATAGLMISAILLAAIVGAGLRALIRTAENVARKAGAASRNKGQEASNADEPLPELIPYTDFDLTEAGRRF